MKPGFLVMETGEGFQGEWLGGKSSAGEVVFNTSHSGYEEIASDPSYYHQIMVMTAPMQGNYGVSLQARESSKYWIEGFVALEIQKANRQWIEALSSQGVGLISGLNTREIVLRIREKGTPWGALVSADNLKEAQKQAQELIAERKSADKDWVWAVSRKRSESLVGLKPQGPRIAVLDFGVKQNIVRCLLEESSEVKIFPSRCLSEDVKAWQPDGIVLSNGPGDPSCVQSSVGTIRSLLDWRPLFGICMGHQLLALALGGKTYKLKFGHRGGNHPVQDKLLNKIYVTSQNHGYAVDEKTLPSSAVVTHINLYDQTVEGIEDSKRKCFSVQFHPESAPGPHEAKKLFSYFLDRLK